MTIKNLTPHSVNIIAEDDSLTASFPSEGIARATQQAECAGRLGDVEVVSMKFGEPVDLPTQSQDTFLIVSVITLNAARETGRQIGDLLLTADPVRNDEGQIIGCRRLATQDPDGFYCNQSEHCEDCKFQGSNCFGQHSSNQ